MNNISSLSLLNRSATLNRARNDSGYLSSSPALSSRSASVNTAYDTDLDLADDIGEEDVFETSGGNHGDVNSNHSNITGVDIDNTRRLLSDESVQALGLECNVDDYDWSMYERPCSHGNENSELMSDDSTPTLIDDMEMCDMFEQVVNDGGSDSEGSDVDAHALDDNCVILNGLNVYLGDVGDTREVSITEDVDNMQCDDSDDEVAGLVIERDTTSGANTEAINCIRRPTAPNPGLCSCFPDQECTSECRLHYEHMLAPITADNNHLYRVTTAPERLEPEVPMHHVNVNGDVTDPTGRNFDDCLP